MQRHKTYYGVSIGILMVNSCFRRYLGDVGNAETWSFPVQYHIVEEAVPERMTMMHESSLLEPFKRAADALVAAGVDGITTTCGFFVTLSARASRTLSGSGRNQKSTPGANGRTHATPWKTRRNFDL